VRDRSGWVSIPVARRTRASKHCLGSTLPDELRGQGYDVSEAGEGQRILPHAITEMVITEGSTVPIAGEEPIALSITIFSCSAPDRRSVGGQERLSRPALPLSGLP
jgi:hypothetical protein